MNVHLPTQLDVEKFRKVHSLMMGGATDGERSAARARAIAMATKAGMTLPEAVSKLDTKPAAPFVNVFAGFDDWMEEKEPGWKTKKAQEKVERNSRDALRRAEILKQYGSERALFARTEREALLDEAIAPLVSKWSYWTDDDGVEFRSAEVIDGHEPKHGSWWIDDITPAIRGAVTNAYPWPSKLDAALREVQFWDRLRWDRGLFCDEWNHYAEVECRIALLEQALKGGQPATCWEDVDARFAWKRYEFSRQWLDPMEPNDPFLARVEADIATLRAKEVPTVGSPSLSPRTNAEKREAVLSMLDAHPEFSDREIARRVGVSPQTVNTWRRKR